MNPSADLYLRLSCSDLLESGFLRPISATVYETDQHLIVIRRDRGLALRQPQKRLIYVIDDDLRGAIKDTRTPAAYRMKLLFAEWRDAARLETRADLIVVTCDELHALYEGLFPQKHVVRLDPAWPVTKLPDPSTAPNIIHVALLMGASHAKDATQLYPVLDRLLVRFPQIRLTVSANLAVPRRWKSSKQVQIVPAMNWHDYHRWLPEQRFNLLLYPLLRGRGLNQARSMSKLGEAAQCGAALFASASWQAGQKAVHERRCVGITDDPAQWEGEIADALTNPDRLRAIALRNRAALIAENQPQKQRDFWNRVLNVPSRHPSRMAAE